MSVEVVVVSEVEQFVVEAPGEFSVVERASQFEIIELAKQGPKGAQGQPGLGGVQSLVAGTNVTIDSTDPANPIISATGGDGALTTANVVPSGGTFYPPSVDDVTGVAVGSGASSSGPSTVAIGSASLANGTFGTALGSGARGQGTMSLSTGAESSASADFATALGGGTRATHNASVALGSSSKTDAENQVSVGQAANGSDPEVTRRISHVSEPVEDSDAATKKFVLDNAGSGGGTAPNPHIYTKTITTTSASETFEIMRLPMPPGTSWNIFTGIAEASFNGKGYAAPATMTAHNESGTIFIGFTESLFIPFDGSFDLVMEGAPVTAAMDGNDIVVSWTVPPDYPGSATWVVHGTRNDGVGFAAGGSPGGGEVPPEMVKAVNTLKIGAPQWFAAPDFSTSGFEAYPSDTLTATVEGWIRAPWSSCSIDWGDGTTGELAMDANKNPSLGPQSQLVFYAVLTNHAYAAPGTYSVSLTMVNDYGSQTFTQDVMVA